MGAEGKQRNQTKKKMLLDRLPKVQSFKYTEKKIRFKNLKLCSFLGKFARLFPLNKAI